MTTLTEAEEVMLGSAVRVGVTRMADALVAAGRSPREAALAYAAWLRNAADELDPPEQSSTSM